jgi:hypothetical protein
MMVSSSRTGWRRRPGVGLARAQKAAGVRGAARGAELLDERAAGPRRGMHGRVEPHQGVDDSDHLIEFSMANQSADAVGGGGGAVGGGDARGEGEVGRLGAVRRR